MHVDLQPLFEELIQQRFGAAVRLRQMRALAGDASTRRYVRLWLDGPPSTPPTLVAMILADRGVAMSSDELVVLAQGPTELPYLNVHRFLVTLGLGVPEVVVDAVDRGVLLLEDVGDVTLWEAAQAGGAEQCLRLYRAAIDQLLLLQIEGTRQRVEGCIAFQQAFDERLFLWEFEHYIEYGIEKRPGQSLAAADATVLRQHFARIARRLDAQPRFLNHRDFHSWNLHVQDGLIRVIDFQDALLAPAPYDLATLLGDRDTPQLIHPAIESELLGYYIEQWNAHSDQPLEPAEAEEVYFLCALQKALKVVGRFFFLDLVKGKPGYMRYIPSTVRQVRRLLPRFPEHAAMAEVLQRYLP